MVIRTNQIAVLEAAMEAGQPQRIVQLLRERDERFEVSEDEDLLELAELGVAKGRRHGVSSDEACWLLTLMIADHGPGFGEDAETEWAAQILRESELDEVEKLRRLVAMERRIAGEDDENGE